VLEEARLRLHVLLERRVVLEVLEHHQVREDAERKAQTEHARLHQRVARDFHDDRVCVLRDLRERGVQLERAGRRHAGVALGRAEARAERADHAGLTPRAREDRLEHVHDGRLADRARDANRLEPLRRPAEPLGGERGQRRARVAYAHERHREVRDLALRDDGGRTLAHGRGGTRVAVVARARDRDEERARAHLPRIVRQRVDDRAFVRHAIERDHLVAERVDQRAQRTGRRRHSHSIVAGGFELTS
jgi:hypothetical protein